MTEQLCSSRTFRVVLVRSKCGQSGDGNYTVAGSHQQLKWQLHGHEATGANDTAAEEELVSILNRFLVSVVEPSEFK